MQETAWLARRDAPPSPNEVFLQAVPEGLEVDQMIDNPFVACKLRLAAQCRDPSAHVLSQDYVRQCLQRSYAFDMDSDHAAFVVGSARADPEYLLAVMPKGATQDAAKRQVAVACVRRVPGQKPPDFFVRMVPGHAVFAVVLAERIEVYCVRFAADGPAAHKLAVDLCLARDEVTCMDCVQPAADGRLVLALGLLRCGSSVVVKLRLGPLTDGACWRPVGGAGRTPETALCSPQQTEFELPEMERIRNLVLAPEGELVVASCEGAGPSTGDPSDAVCCLHFASGELRRVLAGACPRRRLRVLRVARDDAGDCYAQLLKAGPDAALHLLDVQVWHRFDDLAVGVSRPPALPGREGVAAALMTAEPAAPLGYGDFVLPCGTAVGRYNLDGMAACNEVLAKQLADVRARRDPEHPFPCREPPGGGLRVRLTCPDPAAARLLLDYWATDNRRHPVAAAGWETLLALLELARFYLVDEGFQRYVSRCVVGQIAEDNVHAIALAASESRGDHPGVRYHCEAAVAAQHAAASRRELWAAPR
jgi:hypothetical protein